MQFVIDFVGPVLVALVVTSPLIAREFRRAREEV